MLDTLFSFWFNLLNFPLSLKPVTVAIIGLIPKTSETKIAQEIPYFGPIFPLTLESVLLSLFFLNDSKSMQL